MVPIKHYTTDKHTPEALENDLVKRINRKDLRQQLVKPFHKGPLYCISSLLSSQFCSRVP